MGEKKIKKDMPKKKKQPGKETGKGRRKKTFETPKLPHKKGN